MEEQTTITGPTENQDISYFAYLYLMPIIIGIPGNILSILVANRKHNRHLSPSYYIKSLAVVDTVLLVERGATVFINKVVLELNWLEDPLWLVRCQVYVLYTSSILSGLFLAGMSIDRLIAVRFPMDARRLCTVSRTRKIVLGLSLVISMINVHIYFVLYYFKDEQLGISAIYFAVPGQKQIELLISNFHLVIGTILPFLIIFFSNIIIIITLRQAVKNRQKLERKPSKGDDSHLTRMLMFVSFAYIIITLPYRLYHMIMKIPGVGYDTSIPYWKRQYMIQALSFGEVWLFNYCVNFYLYCIGGGQKYRKDAKEVLADMFSCKKAPA